MSEADEIAALRAEVAVLKSTALTPVQRDAVDRLADHVEALVRLVDEDRMRRMFFASARSWLVGLGAVIAALWAAKEGIARALRALIER